MNPEESARSEELQTDKMNPLPELDAMKICFRNLEGCTQLFSRLSMVDTGLDWAGALSCLQLVHPLLDFYYYLRAHSHRHAKLAQAVI